MVSRKLRVAARREPFWQPRYYDFNVRTERKRVEKLRYLHRNPVKRRLVTSSEDWPWSSFRHYVTDRIDRFYRLRHSRLPLFRKERGRKGQPLSICD
jgi:hypothetical protein